jgi:transglutaminase-like putative cysteine protease
VPPSVRLYWRAKVYDNYVDGRWSTDAITLTRTVGLGMPAGEFPDLEGRRTLTFTFTTPRPMVTLYAAPQPQMVSRRVEAQVAENPDGTVDVASLQATLPLRPGETYVASSSVADVTISQLRGAGTGYPQWVVDRYLEIPNTISPRTTELAELIAEGRETPYDVVAAVTRYLRNNIRYSETITGTPASDQEPLDWFLFDVQVGFCNYYASSEVILLRSLGIPARLAVGFAEGEHQRGTNTTLVYERNAHAWPEVYFPGLGWVEFEPTVSQDPILRPLGEIEMGDEGSLRVPAGGDTEDRWRDRLAELEGLDEIAPGGGVPGPSTSVWERVRGLGWALLIALGGVLVYLAWRARRRRGLSPLPVLLETGVRRIGWTPPAFLRRWARRATLSPIERAYGEVDRALRRLGSDPLPADTAAERVAVLANLLPRASESTRYLLAEYQAATYSPHRYNAQVAREAARSIRGLSWRAKLRRAFGRA